MSLQGVTLTDLKEAQRGSRGGQIKDGEAADERFHLRKRATHDGGVQIAEQMWAMEMSPDWGQTDDVSEEDECRVHLSPLYTNNGGISVIHL